MMARRLALIAAGAFSVSVLMAGPVHAVCDPYCSQYSNKGGVDRGVTRANSVANPHGQQGREKAAENPGNYKPDGSDVVSGGEETTNTDTTNTGGTDQTTDTGGEVGPCSGC